MVPGTRSVDGETDLPLIRHELWQSEATAMFSVIFVIFEVHPKQEKFALYLDLAKGLKPILEEIRRFHRQRMLREHPPAGLDPLALNLA